MSNLKDLPLPEKLRTEILKLDLRSGIVNALYAANIKTVGDVMNLSGTKLNGIRRFGSRGKQLLFVELEKIGLTHGQTPEEFVDLEDRTFLDKACNDPFLYEVALTNGIIILCEQAAKIGFGWIRLLGIRNCCQTKDYLGSFLWLKKDEPATPWPRGLDVRENQIVWFADAPTGS